MDPDRSETRRRSSTVDTISSDSLPERNFGRPIKHPSLDDLDQGINDREESMNSRSTVLRDSTGVLRNDAPKALLPNADDSRLNRLNSDYGGCPKDTSAVIPAGQRAQCATTADLNSLPEENAGDAAVLMRPAGEHMVNTGQHGIETQMNPDGEVCETATMYLPDPAEPWTLELPRLEADQVEAEVLDKVEPTTITSQESVTADDTAAEGVSKNELDGTFKEVQERGDFKGNRLVEEDNGKDHDFSLSTTTRWSAALLKKDGAEGAGDESEVMSSGFTQKVGVDNGAESCEQIVALENGQDADVSPSQSVSSPNPAIARHCKIESEGRKPSTPRVLAWKLTRLYVAPAAHRQEDLSLNYERALVFITMTVVVLRILWMAWLCYLDSPDHGAIGNLSSSAKPMEPPWSDNMSPHVVQCYTALAEDDLWAATQAASILELQLRHFWQMSTDEHREQQQQEAICTCRALDEIVRSIMGTADDLAEAACTRMISQR